jgi:hypothetical protein
LPSVLKGCETWTLKLREEQTLRVFNRVLWTIFGLKRNEVTGGWRKQRNEEIHNLGSLPSLIRLIKKSIRFVRYVICIGRSEVHIWQVIRKEATGKNLVRV